MSGFRSTSDRIRFVGYQGSFPPETRDFPVWKGDPLSGPRFEFTLPEIRECLRIHTIFSINTYYI